MSRLMRTSDLMKHPVVTLGGEDVAQVKDIVYSASGGAVGGFTLAGRGRLSGPLKQALAWSSVMALGPDAIMIRDEDVNRPGFRGGSVTWNQPRSGRVSEGSARA